MKNTIILASNSPRRRDLLQQIGWNFIVCPSKFEESSTASDPQALVLQNALGKARDVAAHIEQGIVLGADTIVVHNGAVLSKPANKDEARSMLQQLAGDWHEVYTGVALVDSLTGREVSDVVCTRVHMRQLGAQELEDYLNTDEPYDKAGGYGIQGKAAVFVDRIDGCYFNVVGLPLSRLAKLVQQCAAWS
ncbi:MAG: septum formation inhibitor Maf [Firmicutes bacterium]|jgi:septum formation protein|nr:septum formation inhibitor Maf [Bacillota bacterium]